MIGRNSMKHDLEKKIFAVILISKILLMLITHTEKDFAKTLNKNLGEYHDLCVQNDIIMLADVFTNFQNLGLEIYHLDLA